MKSPKLDDVAEFDEVSVAAIIHGSILPGACVTVTIYTFSNLLFYM